MARLSWLSLQKRDAVGEANLGSPGGALASCGDALGCHELLQLTGLKHFHHDVAAADEFALHISFGARRPVGKFLVSLTDFLILQQVTALIINATVIQNRESTAG